MAADLQTAVDYISAMDDFTTKHEICTLHHKLEDCAALITSFAQDIKFALSKEIKYNLRRLISLKN